MELEIFLISYASFCKYIRNPEVPITPAGLAQLNLSQKEEYLKVRERWVHRCLWKLAVDSVPDPKLLISDPDPQNENQGF